MGIGMIGRWVKKNLFRSTFKEIIIDVSCIIHYD